MTPTQRRWVATMILGAAGGLDLLVLNFLAAPAWVRESLASVPPAPEETPVAPASPIPSVAAAAPIAPTESPAPRSQPAPLSGPVVEENLRFAVASSVLDSSAKGALQAAYERIAAARDRPVLLRGHTDQRGDDKNNDQLSLQRASAAREFLVAAGVPRGSIAIEGVGAREPLDPADTPEARARNRRVEILWKQ